MFDAIKKRFRHLLDVPDKVSPARYRCLQRLMTILMVAVAVTPLLVLSGFSHRECIRTIESELERPLYSQIRKARASLELFLGERAATVALVAHTYSLEELRDAKKFNRIFFALNNEFRGFVDMGLVNGEGKQVMYVGPYKLQDADYRGQAWLRDAETRGRAISGAFLGLRGIPHMVIAVHRIEEDGTAWTLRMTVDTTALEGLVSAAETPNDTDLFIIDREGILQTSSRLYGKALEKLQIPAPPLTRETLMRHMQDKENGDFVMASTQLAGTDFMVVAIRPHTEVFRPWVALGSELLLVLAIGIALIVIGSHFLMKLLVGRLQASDERRAAIFAQMEQHQKLSSIGRLAAGVAHEVNNPLAVISEKAGLTLDFLRLSADVESYEKRRPRMVTLLEGIESTVERARSITHRLLGFARRMGASRQKLHLDEIVSESAEFLVRSARNRGVEISFTHGEHLPELVSDRGLLQQVFLNLIGNAVDASSDEKREGKVTITCSQPDKDHILASVKDNGQGMSEEVKKHIFEPFYSTKQDKGTGLGMFITYGIVRRLGGSITVKSKEGEGSEISVLLPLTPPEETMEG